MNRYRLSLLLLSFAIGCYVGHSSSRVEGKVVDDEWKPIADAEVTLAEDTDENWPNSHTLPSGDDGRYSIGVTHPGALPPTGVVLFTVSKEGYVLHKETFMSGELLYRHTVVLKRRPSGGA